MAKHKAPQSRIAGRNSKTGSFVPVRETAQRSATSQREHIPLPGHSESRKKTAPVYRSSPSGRFVEREQNSVTTAKGETVVIYRDSETGRYTTTRSAERIESTTKRAYESLKRLAKK
jgi:hypothetical protein